MQDSQIPESDRSRARPVIVWDGDCGFCRHWVMRWGSATGDRVSYATSQEMRERIHWIPRKIFEDSVVLLGPDGTYKTGAHAVFAALATVPGRGWPLWLYKHFPPFRWVAEWVYRLIARNRPIMYKLTVRDKQNSPKEGKT